MTEDDKIISDALKWLRDRVENKTEQAEHLAAWIAKDNRLRAAVARQIIARQVPLVGEVT